MTAKHTNHNLLDVQDLDLLGWGPNADDLALSTDVLFDDGGVPSQGGAYHQTEPSAWSILLPADLESVLKKGDGGSRRVIASRLGMFADWLDVTGRTWLNPDLTIYRDYLVSQGKSPATVNAYLGTVRSRYQDLLTDNLVIQMIGDLAADRCVLNGWLADPANVSAVAERMFDDLLNELDPRRIYVKELVVQDREEGAFIRLARSQAEALMSLPGVDTLRGLRDTALIVLTLATGARVGEIVALQVGDHKSHTESGALALLIRCGKGSKQRLVPYGELRFAVSIVDRWLESAGIVSGPIFRGFYRGRSAVRPHALSTVAVEHIVSGYKVFIDGELRSVKPHDLRRTYARLMYDGGMPLVAIQQNLGHADVKTTLQYIGLLDDLQRQPRAVLSFGM